MRKAGAWGSGVMLELQVRPVDHSAHGMSFTLPVQLDFQLRSSFVYHTNEYLHLLLLPWSLRTLRAWKSEIVSAERILTLQDKTLVAFRAISATEIIVIESCQTL